ncbi:hypothetical protein ACKWTF_012605 [Chironomus riparius]
MDIRPKCDILEVLKNPKNGKFCCVVAPMVRYSRLEFRSLARNYGADICFTPMTIANSFIRSEKCRQVEFTTNLEDNPVIAQFAANCTTDFLYATQMIQNYVDGVDLNCGCPQKWAKEDGYGCYLLKKSEVIEDMMKTVRRNTPSDFSVSIKIRLLTKDIKNTVELCRQLQSLNVSFITVHGRTPSEKSSSDNPVDYEAITEIKKSLSIPVIFNGDVSSLDDANKFYEHTRCDGFMSARGMLANPALFAGYKETPVSCIHDWIDIHHQQNDRMTFQNFHHHLVFMMESMLNKAERNLFNDFTKKKQCLEFLEEKFSLTPKPINFPQNTLCTYDDSNYKQLISNEEFWRSSYTSESSHGQFFLSKLHKIKTKNDDYLEFMDNCSDLFS